MKLTPATLILATGLSSIIMCFPLHAQTPKAQTEERGLQVRPTRQVTQWPGSSKRWALIIGVDQYKDRQIGSLSGAANDAKMLTDTLIQRAGFPADQVILLATDQPEERQPTRINILRRLSNLTAAVPKDGLLLFSYSGHGMERGGKAYLLPSDAQISDDVSFLEETALSLSRVKDRIKATGVQQVLLLLDACRNDPTGRADAPNKLTEAYTRGFNFDVRNQEVSAFATLYATAVGERAYEYAEKRQGYFTWAIVEGLKGAAANEQGEVTLSGLIKYVQETVPKRIAIDLGAGKQQRPFVQMDGYKADELVITITIKPSTGEIKAAVSNGSDAIELSFWETIKNSANPEDFVAYLQQYPNGRFASLARIRAERASASSQILSLDFSALSGASLMGKDVLGRGIDISAGSLRIETTVGSNLVMPDGLNKTAFFLGPAVFDSTAPAGLTCGELTFTEGDLTAISVTRPGVSNNASTPAWQMKAFNAKGVQVGAAVGEGDLINGSYLFPSAPQDFTITGEGIHKIQVCSKNHLSTFGAIPIARISRQLERSLTGTWVNIEGGPPMQLIQQGNRVTGIYQGSQDHEGLTGKISGTFDGKTFVGTYENNEGKISGRGTLSLILNGDRLEGHWVSTTALGQKGEWVLKRQPQ
jgi:hypothetical protein